MAKIAPTSIKYIVYANFEAEGAIEKPDVIGAVFGQTEGLLGEGMEMRELQKQGKIGRIEVEINSENGKTSGEIEIPSAMDKNETSLIAAALETIEKIGPSETTIKVEKIEDVRGSKRDYILERARQLMGGIHNSGGVEDMSRELGSLSRTSSLKSYGVENLPCGDLSEEEIIIVEGRADVVNMLKQGVKNVIAMNGMKLPETIKELSQQKTATLFVDGDRGGQLIIKNVTENASIDYIAVAPDGKEVEELTSKEILQSLRKKLGVSEFFKSKANKGTETSGSEKESDKPIDRTLTEEELKKVKVAIQEVIGTKAAIIFDSNLEIIEKVPVSRLVYLKPKRKPFVIAINDTAVPKIIQSVEDLGVKNLVAKNFTSTDTELNLISL